LLAALGLAAQPAEYRFAKTIGKPGKGEGQLRHPQSVAVAPDGSIYVVNRERHRILKYGSDGAFLLEFGSGNQSRAGLTADPAKSDQCCFHLPYAVAVAPDGSVYVSDWRNHRIVKNSPDGTYQSEIPGSGVGYDMQLPTSIAVDGKGNVAVLSAGADRQRHFITFFDAESKFVERRRVPGSCLAIALRPTTGDLYVTQNARYIEYLADGTMTGWMGRGNLHKGTTALFQYRIGWFGKEFLEARDGLKYYQENGDEPGAFDLPQGLAIDEPRGRIIVADTRNNRIQVFSLQHERLAVFGERGTKPGQFRLPVGVAVDGDGNIYVADKYNDRVQMFTRTR
jgi:sugar lactone lactonase YvrE